MKTGADHVRSLRDEREVYLNGELVADVTTSKAYRNAVANVGVLYDFVSDPANRELMTYGDSEGGPYNRIWQLPRSREELIERRKALEAWSELHLGYMGRAPDHVASCISGMYMGRERFASYDEERAAALSDYYTYARDNDVYLSYVIINPQSDRTRSQTGEGDPFVTAGVVDQDESGLIIRGAKMLGTGAVMANEIFVTCIQPLPPDDTRYAVSFAVPMNLPGMKVMSRKSYEAASVSEFDNPLAHNYDENDAVIYFDDALVPWERVFVNQDTAMTLAQFHETPAHVWQNYQAQIRLSVKMRFLSGLAKRIAEVNGLMGVPPVRETLGQIAAETQLVTALVAGMEAEGDYWFGYFVPHPHTLYTAQVLTQQLYGKFTARLRDLAGGGMIMLPSSQVDYQSEELRTLIRKTQQSPTASAEDRVKLFKLAWDAVGSEFGSRHVQYEMFYAGAAFVTKGHSFRRYDWDAATELVDRVLDSYPSPQEGAE